MKVIVDTFIWSHVLRSNTAKDQRIVNTLTELLRDVIVQLIGPIRQEILSGIKSEEQFIELKDYCMAFADRLAN